MERTVRRLKFRHYELRVVIDTLNANMTLYRVSTTKQVDVVKDDIPMQKIACRNFIEEKKWQLVGEKEEKGVSGFKVSPPSVMLFKS